MSLILCIEAGTDVGSVALARDGKLLSLRESGESRQHARNLGVYVGEVLREHDVDADELDAVAVGKGPGSYTGLRIAVSLAKGICYAAGKPLIAVNSLEAMTRVALEDYEAGILGIDDIGGYTLLPMIDARRMEVYCQLFDAQAAPLSQVEARVLDAESFLQERRAGKLLLFGNGSDKCRTLFTEQGVTFAEVAPSARGLVKPAFDRFEKSDFEDVAYFEPFYLKNFVATVSTKKIF